MCVGTRGGGRRAGRGCSELCVLHWLPSDAAAGSAGRGDGEEVRGGWKEMETEREGGAGGLQIVNVRNILFL